jgi:hypothetical protein
VTDLLAPLARAIRDRVKLAAGPNFRDILSRGGTLHLNGGEADEAASAVLEWLDANGYAVLPKASVETVLLDHAHQLEGDNADPELADLAHVYERITGFNAPRQIAEDRAALAAKENADA